MRLTSLELQNFRGFESLSLSFHPKVTVIVGVNGSGKTSILDAIAKEVKRITPHGTGLSFVDEDQRNGAAFFEIELRGVSGDEEVILHHGFKEGKEYPGAINQTLVFSSDQQAKGPLPLLVYYPVSRHANDATPGAKNPRHWRASSAWIESLHQPKTTFGEFFEWFRDREDLENEGLRDNPEHIDVQLEAVRKSLELLLPGYSNPRIKRQPTPVLTAKKNGQVLSFNQLSEGERTLAALGCDIARRLSLANPGSNPLDGEGVVLIDEIDLHLHPEWQRNIIPALTHTFPNLQFVVTTHSPIVLSYIDSECIRLIEDFKLVEKLPPTWGRDPNSILTEIFDQPLRAKEMEKELHELAVLIDEAKHDQARRKLDEIRSKLGDDDAEVVRYTTMIEMFGD